MRRHRPWMGALVLAGLLAAVTGWARDEEADTEAPAEKAADKCAAACESQHAACVSTVKAHAADCERLKIGCERNCWLCPRLNGPASVGCVTDCERCRDRYAASQCTTAPPNDAECDSTRDACLERCGP